MFSSTSTVEVAAGSTVSAVSTGMPNMALLITVASAPRKHTSTASRPREKKKRSLLRTSSPQSQWEGAGVRVVDRASPTRRTPSTISTASHFQPQ